MSEKDRLLKIAEEVLEGGLPYVQHYGLNVTRERAEKALAAIRESKEKR